MVFGRKHGVILGLIILMLYGCPAPTSITTPPNTSDVPSFYWAVDWHPDGEQIVVGGSLDTLRLVSTQTHGTLQNYPYKGTLTKTKWHPSLNRMAVSVQDGVSYPSIVDLDGNRSIRLDSVSAEGARALGWNRSGSILAVGDYEGALRFYDAHGTYLKSVDTGQKSIIGLAWHPSENRLVAVGEKISLYDYESGTMDHINDREEPIEVLLLCVAWHPDGDFFVTGDYGDFEQPYPPLLQYWTAEGQRMKAIEGSKAEYRNLQWSSDGHLLATASEKLRLWDRNGTLVDSVSVPDLLWGIAWNPEGTRLVTTDEKGRISFWNRELELLPNIR